MIDRDSRIDRRRRQSRARRASSSARLEEDLIWRAETPTRGGGQQRTARSRRRSAHLRSRKRSSARRVSAVSREKKRADAVRVRLRDVTRALGRSGRPGEGGAPLPLDVESKGRANTPAGCARSVGFAADLRRGSLCGIQRGCRRARMWRAVHASGATVVCGTRVGHGLEGKRESEPVWLFGSYVIRRSYRS